MKRTLSPTFVLSFIFLLGCNSSTPTNPVSTDEAAVRHLAEDFLILVGPYLPTDKADRYTTKRFQKEITETRTEWYEFKAWSISSVSVNAGKTEATVRGSLQATKKCTGKRGAYSSSDFTETVGFRLQMMNDQGNWLVDRVDFGAAPPAERNDPK